jgi:hypothetical protein
MIDHDGTHAIAGRDVSVRIARRDALRYGAAGVAALALDLGSLRSLAWASPSTPSADRFDADVPTAWFDLSLRLVRGTAGFSPPVAARAFAYAGIALYEALVPGIPDAWTLAGRLDGLSDLPHAGKNRVYHWPTVANASLSGILRRLFPTATAENLAAIDDLESRTAGDLRVGLPPGVFRRSVERGSRIAAAVFEWSRSDGGHEAFLRNFPPEYVPPVGPGLWVPTPPGFLPALQPFWGACRTFASASGESCPPGDHTPYSEDRASAFFAEAVEAYDAVNGITDEQREIASFWSDDPGATSTPPGHSISILTQTLRGLGASLDVAAEAYARVGMAVADAFICCWNVKYRYNLLRPITYIQANIDPSWSSLLTTPPFPEYPSGHSVQSGASARVLTDLFGEVAFTDHTHDDRGLTPRSFGSFEEAAAEAAISRLYGGIHFRPAIDLGLDQGRCIGEHVSALELRG